MRPYVSHDGGEEEAVITHPAIHTGLCVHITHIGKEPIEVKELPLWVEEVMTFLWLQVRIQGDGNSQEDIKAEGPIIRDSVIIEDVDPAAMPWNSCSEVLQQYMACYHHERRQG